METPDVQGTEKPPISASPTDSPIRICRPKWERLLPKKFVIAATENNPTALKLKVEIETTDTAEKKSISPLVDCRATREVIDRHYAKSSGFKLVKLTEPIPVFNVNGTPNKAGSITEVVNLILHYKNHSERTTFAVCGLGKQKLILGHSWLREHNPEINWVTQEVKMSRCPPRCCPGCRDEVRQERAARKAEIRRMDACTTGLTPEIDHDFYSPDEGTSDEVPESIEDEDRIFATGLLPSPSSMDIRASSTISQRLAEAFKSNSEATSPPIPEYLKEFSSVFSKESFDVLPESKDWDHAIELIPGSKASNSKVYPLSPSEQKELDVFLKENLETRRIRPSKSPMASPVFFIKKKDGSLRLVQDYRALNAMTVKNKYPLPLISELVNKLQGAKYFTKLDVCWGFNNVHMKDGDEWKAAFRMNCGLYEPLVMFFGLTNSPSTFQTMMNDIFQDLIMEGVVCVYLDDILIFAKSMEEQRRVTRLVLELLRKHKLFLRHEKCEFEKTSIEYLRLIISEGEMRMDPVKVAGVTEWPAPTNRKEVQSFLGFANFYRRFIEGFLHHAKPMFELTKKDRKWSWGTNEQSAFDEIKTRITSSPILRFADDSKSFRIEADSSDYATGSVLSQQSSDDLKWHPIAFYSKSLNAVERNYEIYDKEMLAVMRSLEEWRHFLKGVKHKVEIWTDHKNLEYFMTAKKLNRRQARWSLYLSRFDFVMHHRPGKSMGKSDALSRRSDHSNGADDNHDTTLLRPEFFAIRALDGITFEGAEKELLREIRRGVRDGKSEDAVMLAMKDLERSRGKTLRSSEWAMEDGLWRFRDRIYVPMISELRCKIAEQHHDSKIGGHAGRWKTLELVR